MKVLYQAGFLEAAMTAGESRNPAWALKCWERPALGLVDWAAVEGARSVR